MAVEIASCPSFRSYCPVAWVLVRSPSLPGTASLGCSVGGRRGGGVVVKSFAKAGLARRL